MICPILDFVNKHTEGFIAEHLSPRSLEEMKEIQAEFFATFGLDVPDAAFARIGYTGDGKHYRCWLPNRAARYPLDLQKAEAIRETNKGKWGEEVNVSEEAYSKVSHKPGTRGKNCLAHLCFWNLTGLCIGVLAAVWSGCPDIVQSRRFNAEIKKMLEK